MSKTAAGVPKILMLQKFQIKGHNFSTDLAKNKIYVLKKGVSVVGLGKPGPFSPVQTTYETVATITPNQPWGTTASTNLLYASMAGVAPGDYFLQVEVEGVGKSNIEPILVPQIHIKAVPPGINGISPAKQTPSGKIELSGHGLFPDGVVIFQLADNPKSYLYPVKAWVSPSRRRVDAYVPAKLEEGQYKVWMVTADGKTKTNAVNLKVLLAPGLKYQLTLDAITCLEESADGSDSDETYAAGIVFDTVARNYTQKWTKVYEDFDNKDMEKPNLTLFYGEMPNPDQWIFVMGLAECDNYKLSDDIVSGTHWDWTKKIHNTSVNLTNWGEYQLYLADGDIYDAYIRNQTMKNATRDQSVKFIQDAVGKSLQSGGDELLGVHEIRITKEDLAQARSNDGQFPAMKTYACKGDDSNYRVTYVLRLVKPQK